MERLILDKIDLNILSTLARDCRTSYNSIGSQIGLTSKSVKARVKNMIFSGVIEMFVVRVNPAAFGHRTALVLVRTSNGITKDNVIQRVKQFGDLAFMYIIWEELLWLPLSLIFILVTDKKYYVTRFEEVNIHFDEILPSCRKHIALVLIIMIRTKIVHSFKIS